MVLLAGALIFAASLLLLPTPPSDLTSTVFQSYRQDDGTMFVSDRMVRAPIFYGWLHAVPGSLWCVLIPLQYVRRLRAKYPAVHRWSGRLTILLSFVLSTTGLLMSPRKLIYTHPNTWHIHRLRLGPGKSGVTVLVWPTFEALSFLIGGLLAYTAYNTLYYARRRDYAKHRVWAEMCTLVGQVVPLQRVCMLPVSLAGSLTPLLSASQQKFLRVPTDVVGKAAAERAAFAWTAWTSFALIITFALHKNSELDRAYHATRKAQ